MQTLYGGGISAKDFYTRRARRLLPAYFGLVIATVLVCAVVTLPGELTETVTQALWASVLAANIGYWSDVSYFDAQLFRPMLHLWSLGVEAQFYLLFPLLVRLNRRWLVLVLLISFAACLVTVPISPKLPFYMMPLRVWEFVIGMLAARVQLQRRPALGAAALLGILLCLFIPVDGIARNIVTGHPALPALAITLLTATTLVFRLPEAAEQSLPGVAAQKVGDASYSLYLAHFPIIVLLNYQPFSGTRLGLTPWTIPLIVLATLALYFGLERRGPRLFSVKRSLAAMAAVWALAWIVPQVKLLSFSPRERLIFAATHDRSAYHCGKLFRVIHPREKFCLLEAGEPMLFVGDSHADAIKTSFAAVAHKHGWGVYFPIDNDPLLSKQLSPAWLRREADRRRARWVVLHFAGGHFTPELVEAARREIGDRLIVIEATPSFNESVPQALFEHKPLVAEPPKVDLKPYLAAHPQIPSVDPMPALCPGKCLLQDSAGRPLYFDKDHLTLSGARLLEPALDDFFTKVVDKRR
jgi:peptidoglycan/LPS O-acetylase OafA/YrhL